MAHMLGQSVPNMVGLADELGPGEIDVPEPDQHRPKRQQKLPGRYQEGYIAH